MYCINKAILLGYVGANPIWNAEIQMAKINIATPAKYKDKNGNIIENNEWHTVVCWGNLGKYVADNITKGSTVYIEGKMKRRKYDDKNYFEIIAERVNLIRRKEDLADDF